VAQSRYGVDYLLHQGVLPSRIILLPFGVDTERFRPVVRDRSTTFRVLFAGQLGVRKGLHILLEAWQKLALPDAELVLVGGLGDQGAAILDAFGAHRYWRGFVSDDELPDLYRSSDVFVLPSFSEGGANVVYEALASGVTCVVSKNAGSAVREGAEGFVVDVGDTEALADRIQTLYRDRELCANMGVAARRQAERYSWSEFSRRLAATYRNIATGWPDWPNDIRDMSAY
jgi:glycosyltransferase involved in cell wall biosynthesis